MFNIVCKNEKRNCLNLYLTIALYTTAKSFSISMRQNVLMLCGGRKKSPRLHLSAGPSESMSPIHLVLSIEYSLGDVRDVALFIIAHEQIPLNRVYNFHFLILVLLLLRDRCYQNCLFISMKAWRINLCQ